MFDEFKIGSFAGTKRFTTWLTSLSLNLLVRKVCFSHPPEDIHQFLHELPLVCGRKVECLPEIC